MKNTLFCYFAILITLAICSACDTGQQMVKPALTPATEEPGAPTQALTPIAQERIAVTQAPTARPEEVDAFKGIPRINFQEAITQKHIQGPYLWLASSIETFRTIDQITDEDAISNITNGAVSETDIATEGIDAYMDIENFNWTLGTLPGEPNAPDYNPVLGADNIRELVLAEGLLNHSKRLEPKTIYGLLSIVSDKEYPATLNVGSDDAIKIWLNGEVVHRNPIARPTIGFQDTLRVMINKGDNLLLVKVADIGGHWAMFLGLEQTEAPVDPTQHPFPEQPTVPPDASQPLTKGEEYLMYKQTLTDALYTSRKLKDAVDSGMYNRKTDPDSSDYRFGFEPRLGGTGRPIDRSRVFSPQKEYALIFKIVFNNIEVPSPIGWTDKFGVLHSEIDHPYFSPPDKGVILDRETERVLSSFKFFEEAGYSGGQGQDRIPFDELLQNTRNLTAKELWEEKSKYFSVLGTAGVTFVIRGLSIDNWSERREIIDALLARSVIRIRLENGMLFDYDFLELFPNPVIITPWSHTNHGGDVFTFEESVFKHGRAISSVQYAEVISDFKDWNAENCGKRAKSTLITTQEFIFEGKQLAIDFAKEAIQNVEVSPLSEGTPLLEAVKEYEYSPNYETWYSLMLYPRCYYE